MTYKNICRKKVYTDKSGKEVVKWLNVGTLKETDDGKQFIEINVFPEAFYVFTPKPKEDNGEVEL